MEPRFKINEKLILSDNTEWTIEKVIDLNKVKDKFYRALQMGTNFDYYLKRELTGSIIRMKEETLIKTLK